MNYFVKGTCAFEISIILLYSYIENILNKKYEDNMKKIENLIIAMNLLKNAHFAKGDGWSNTITIK